ncbi:acyl-CoA-binding protein [Pandoraea terrae]|uniref:Acyl-CoA-binding protein n=1 Tax=Pandoraea terrae TaxID=1537710 RepID=A0A5E4UNE9_9BURK|nr:acyl-CoA-binding protein [Pandoraea terrae]VVE01456.1 acyl-CoA-binding protein [Pandoraea terrae]
MNDLQTRFEAAVAASKTLTERPDNLTLLRIYALYKQSTHGDVDGKRPGMMEMVDRAKYDAWSMLKGTPADDAKTAYVALIESLRA